jgi:5'-nucleotidase
MHRPVFVLVVSLALFACSTQVPRDDVVTISVVGINDIHGQLNASEQSGGLVAIAAYVDALRAARQTEGGAVVVVDAGDMWQGTLESNLVEGASMVAAYNALGVAAAAIGNHEFDFGPEGPKPVPMADGDDPRGALKQRAREADFQLLAANLIDDETGRPVDWNNIFGTMIVSAAGVRVGIIGVTTSDSLRTTIAANTDGLSIAPLAETISREAITARQAGADLVIVAAHAGGRCQNRTDDAQRCDLGGELAAVAHGLEPGLVDHIFGGHIDTAMAEVINGISVSINRGKAQSFGRVDFVLDRGTGKVLERRAFPPQANPVQPPATYEGRPLVTNENVASIAREAAALAAEVEREPVGIELAAPFPLTPDMNSALFNLVTTALLDSFDVDVAMHNVRGGLRARLPAGPLTFGDLYEMFPFDNFVTILDVSGAELRRVIAAQAKSHRRVGFAGMRVIVDCEEEQMSVRMLRPDGREIGDDEQLSLLVNDYMALGGDAILAPIMPPGGFAVTYGLPRTRDAIIDWLRSRGGELHPADWGGDDAPMWSPANRVPSGCMLTG